MKYTVTAKVRGAHSIGCFYPVSYIIEADNTDEAKRQWFTTYEDNWELHHFISIKEIKEVHEDPYLKLIMEHE
jgi:hypothetical protein